MSQILSLAEARRIALAAQSFVPEAAAPKRVAALAKMVRRLGAVQIDSVNVLVRSHYLPVYSRCGSYAPALLERAAYDGTRALFEYWGHEASLLPVELYPLFRWRMQFFYELHDQRDAGAVQLLQRGQIAYLVGDPRVVD